MKKTENNESFRPITVEDHKELGRRQAGKKKTAVNDALQFPVGDRFDEDLESILNSTEAADETIVIALMDCDSFDHINHDFGPDEGDRILIEADCRSGRCGWCRSRLVSGDVFVPESRDGRLTGDAEYGWIHPCVTYPLSDLTLEIFNH